MKDIEIHFNNKRWAGQTDCYIVARNADGSRSVAKPMRLEFEPVREDIKQDPSLTFDMMMRADGFFEALVKGLAEAGYKQESNDAGELRATKLHLADMKTLVFKETKCESKS